MYREESFIGASYGRDQSALYDGHIDRLIHEEHRDMSYCETNAGISVYFFFMDRPEVIVYFHYLSTSYLSRAVHMRYRKIIYLKYKVERARL